MTRKPILALDFDGVLHSYASGWQGIDVIPDPPVEGAMAFLDMALAHFDVVIHSSRCATSAGRGAMRRWLRQELFAVHGLDRARAIVSKLRFAKEKPPAHVFLDDRAVTFDGVFKHPALYLAFTPWHSHQDDPLIVPE